MAREAGCGTTHLLRFASAPQAPRTRSLTAAAALRSTCAGCSTAWVSTTRCVAGTGQCRVEGAKTVRAIMGQGCAHQACYVVNSTTHPDMPAFAYTTPQDIVVLSGGHTLGRARPERSGFGEFASPLATFSPLQPTHKHLRIRPAIRRSPDILLHCFSYYKRRTIPSAHCRTSRTPESSSYARCFRVLE